MTKLRYLSVLLSQRLTLAAQEIFKDVEETILELQEELKLVKLENTKLKLKLREAGPNTSDETSSAQKTGEFKNSGESRTESVSEDRLIIASLKQELDAQDENEEGSGKCGEMGGPAERGVMQIKMETDFTECSPTERLSRERSAGQTGPVVSGCVGDETLLPASEPREPEVFPCVERTWSVCDPVAKEAEPQDFQTQEKSDDSHEGDGRHENVPKSDHTDMTQTAGILNGDCLPEDYDNEDDYDIFNDHDEDPVKDCDNVEEMPQMPLKKSCTREELSKCEKSYPEKSCKEVSPGREASSEKGSIVKTVKPRGRPRKHPQTSTPLPETRASCSWLRSGNDRGGIAERQQKGHGGHQTPSDKSIENLNEKDGIGRPTRSYTRNMEDEETTSVQVLNTDRTEKRRGRPRKNPQIAVVKSAEVAVDQENSVSEELPISENNKDLSTPNRRSGRLRERSEVHSVDEGNTAVLKSNPAIKTGRPRGRPRKNPQSTTAKPTNMDLDHEESLSEKLPIFEDSKVLPRSKSTSKSSGNCVDTSTVQSVEMDHYEGFSDDKAISVDYGDLSVLNRPQSVLKEKSTRKLLISEVKASSVSLEDEESSLGLKTNQMEGTEQSRVTPHLSPQSTTVNSPEMDLDYEDSVSEKRAISENNDDLSRPARRSGRLRKHAYNSTLQPDKMDNQDDISSDEDGSGDDRDLSLLGRPPRKRSRSSSSEYEIDMEQEDDFSDSSCERLTDSTIKERPRKKHRILRTKAVEAGLDHVSVLNKDMGLLKRHYCLYCAKPVRKIARHLGMRHYDEQDVIKALTLPKNSKQRKIEITRLRNFGNRAHNSKVLKEGKGLVIPNRVHKSQEPNDLVYCHGCSGLFGKDYMSRHTRYCVFVKAGPEGVAEEDQSSCTVTEKVPKDFSEVLAGMYQDDVADAAKGDPSLLKLGEFLFTKRYSHQYIWQRLRELGRLLLNGRKITPLNQIEDYIRPENWDHLAVAVKDVTGYCDTTRTFAIPKYAKHIRIGLASIAGILKCDAEKRGDKEKVKIGKNFQDNLKMRWHLKFIAPEKPNSSSSLLQVAEQTSNGTRDNQGNGSEENTLTTQTDTKHEMLLERTENHNSVSPAADDLQRYGDDDDDNDTDDIDDDGDEDDMAADDEEEEDEESCHNAEGDGDIPANRLENKTDNAKVVNLNGSCDDAQNDCLSEALNELQPQTVSTTKVTTVSVSNTQENISDQAAAQKTSVASSTKSGNDHQISVFIKHNRKHYCLFCKQAVSKISKHLANRHYEQEDVAKAFSYPKLSKERKLCLKRLLRMGNRAHNVQVLKEGRGDLVPCKWGTGKPADFLHCPYCDGLFLKRRIAVHLKKCPFAAKTNLTETKKGKRGSVVALCLMAEPIPEDVSEEFWRVLVNMNQDEISAAVRGDKHGRQLGQQLMDKGQGEEHIREDYIRQRLRELGRLLVSCRKITPMYNLKDFILPSNWHHLVAVVKDVAGLNKEDPTLNVTVLSHLYRSLQKIGRLVESDAESKQDAEGAEMARTFNKDFVEKWRMHFPTPFETRKSQQCQSDGVNDGVKLLSFTEDIRNLHTYLKDRLNECLSELSTLPSLDSWNNLVRIVLAQLIMFNRKKAEEIAGMTLKDFNTKETYGMPDDAEEDSTEFERELCKFTCRMEISQPTGNNLRILIPPSLTNVMTTMLHKRLLCGIRCDNIYMFAVPKCKSYFLGVESLKNLAEDCGVKHSEVLVSNGMRTHIAMITRLLYLKDMHQLTEFMGVNLTAHLRNDCLQQETLELAKLGKLFTAMDKGECRNPEESLNEVQVSPVEIVHMDDRSSTEESEDVDYQPSKPAKSTKRVTARRRSVTKHKWSEVEVQAVEKHMDKFISSGKTPGKKACTACIMAEQDALKARNWKNIKFYIKNRITSLRKQSSKPLKT